MMHPTGVVEISVSDKCHRAAINIKSAAGEQRKPPVPLMGDSGRFNLHSKATRSLDYLSELRKALALLKPTNREMKICNPSVAINGIKRLVSEPSLTRNPKCLSHLRVWIAEMQRNMILASRMSQNASREHELPRRLLGYNRPQELAAVSPRAGNTNDGFLAHGEWCSFWAEQFVIHPYLADNQFAIGTLHRALKPCNRLNFNGHA